FISPDRDPDTLCPYCDTPLPPNPSPLLQQLLASAFENSKAAPRPANPHGRFASITVFVDLCSRHQLESQIFPVAERNGWPTSVDWDGLAARVVGMRGDLENIIRNEDHREQSIFWRVLDADLKRVGPRKVSSIRGQLSRFQREQPGYYGEKGSLIIHQTLYTMFAESTNKSLVKPLSVREFIGSVLVPEVGVRLIMVDMSLGMEGAAAVMRESAEYGVAMFPDKEFEQEGDE
ncbi:RTC4-like domain-containing protein, partial [Favolaschia claudopus]